MAIFGHKHIPFASVSEEAQEVSITFSAPTKTFNMAGIVSSWCVVPNATMREPLFRWLRANELNEPTMFAPVATIAAFKNGEPWRKAMLAHVEANINFIIEYCKDNIPQIHPVRPQASYLLWLDCRGLGLSHIELARLFEEKAGLALNHGDMFGKEGEGFMRMNVGCPIAIIEKAMNMLKKAVDEL